MVAVVCSMKREMSDHLLIMDQPHFPSQVTRPHRCFVLHLIHVELMTNHRNLMLIRVEENTVVTLVIETSLTGLPFTVIMSLPPI